MKRFVAITALVATAQASAFWGWNDDSTSATNIRQEGHADLDGDTGSEAGADFSMKFSGRSKTRGHLEGAGDSEGGWAGYGYEAPYYYGYTPYYYTGPQPAEAIPAPPSDSE
ncbi:MAG: hypothetical protein D6720_10265 [Gammaproteobacteria bacterium]|nr:MAG: hypothetical protein D6720_10265 [Gammaproteobacteria bacterium]